MKEKFVKLKKINNYDEIAIFTIINNQLLSFFGFIENENNILKVVRVNDDMYIIDVCIIKMKIN